MATYYVSGFVKENGTPIANRLVVAFRRSDMQPVGMELSAVDGSYNIGFEAASAAKVLAVCFRAPATLDFDLETGAPIIGLGTAYAQAEVIDDIVPTLDSSGPAPA